MCVRRGDRSGCGEQGNRTSSRCTELGKETAHQPDLQRDRIHADERNVPLDGTYRSALPIVVIKSFADKRTAAIFVGYAVRDLPQQIQRRARAKLLAIDAASLLDDLRIPPGNRLEALRGDRQGQFSIRVNDQWRICFVWRNNEAWDVEIVDYH